MSTERTYKRRDCKEIPLYNHILKLREIRKSKNISQIDMAKVLNVAHITYVQWERGINAPRYDLFITWCNFLKYDLCKLNY